MTGRSTTGTVEVTVVEDGAERVWRHVDDLAAAGPDDAVFALAPDSGAVVFGDGEHGRRPADGARVRATYFSGRRLSVGEVTYEQEYRRDAARRGPAGPLSQIMPAGGWSLVRRGADGEQLVPLVGWALLEAFVPVYRNGDEPPQEHARSVRGLVVGPHGQVVVVDEAAADFGGYRPDLPLS